MMSSPKTFTLNTGASVPAVGLGTFQSGGDNAVVVKQVKDALEVGYRHIDTAMDYKNERQVGVALKESGIPRAELFVTTKLHQTWHQPEEVAEALDRSLKNLELEYVDLYLMHFPHAYKPGDDHATIRRPDGSGKPVIDHNLSRRYTDTWKAMEALFDSGKARAIGLSNFNILKTKRVLEVARIKPAVNQVELHPLLPQQALVDYCKEQGIVVMAHQPLGGRPIGPVKAETTIKPPLELEDIRDIALRHSLTPAQVCLSWAVERGIPVVPKTVNQGRMKENIELVRLSREVIDAVDALEGKYGATRFLDPSKHIGFDIFDEEQDQPVA